MISHPKLYLNSICHICGKQFSFQPQVIDGKLAERTECDPCYFKVQTHKTLESRKQHEEILQKHFTSEERKLLAEADIEIMWGRGNLTQEQKALQVKLSELEKCTSSGASWTL